MLRNKTPSGGLFRVTLPVSAAGGEFSEPRQRIPGIFRRDRHGCRDRYFHACPAYFPQVKKKRGDGGSDLSGSPGVG